MPSMSSDHDDLDIESQQTAFLIDGDSPRDLWRWIFVILRARRILVSRVDRAKKASTDSKVDADLKQPEIEEILPRSPQVSLEVNCDGMDGPIDVSDVKLQHANIAQIVKGKDLGSLQRFGGVRGIAEALDTDLEKGIPGDEEDLRSRCIINKLSEAEAPERGLLKSLLRSCNSYIIFLLCVSAAMSIGFGINEKGPQTGWCQGVIIILAIIVLVVVSLRRDFWHRNSKLSEKQNPPREKRMEVDVLRGGNWQTKSISDVVNGDIVCLRRGYCVPGDGLFISGECLKLDDSLSTIDQHNPFLYYGSKVINGHGRMLVTSVGKNTVWGEMMSQVTQAPSKIKLPTQLDRVNMSTQIVGLLVSILMPVVVFLHFKLGKEHHDSGLPEMKGKPNPMKAFIDIIERIFMKPRGNVSILTTSLAVLVVGIVEGVPFIVTIAIFYWNKKAMSDKAFAQESLACVSMGSVTTICTEKTGGLTLDQQEVDMCWIDEQVISEHSVIDSKVLEALRNGISAPFLMLQSTSCSTRDPLISWATLKLGLKLELMRESCSIIDAKQLSSSGGGNGVLMMKKRDEKRCLHWSGPAKTILTMCSHYYDRQGKEKTLDDHKRSAFEQNIEHMRSKNLKTVALAYKMVDSPTFEDNNLILIGLIGLKNICPTKTRKATKAFTDADVNIILISEEDVSVLKAIELECGLFQNPERLVLEGEVFRGCTDVERMQMVDNISVIGNSLPSDKLLLVQCLKQKGHKVAMVGARTNDTPALKEANLGIAMGSWSSELARESSDIVVYDGDFNSLLIICSYGRCAYDNIQKYIQFEITMFVSWILITIITTAAFGDAPITEIHWFWANLVVAFPGGLALLMEPPSKELMNKPPVRQTDPFITKAIWRNIITQALFQVAILVTLQFKCNSIQQMNNEKLSETMVFNSFVLLQVFNLINARKPNTMNVFKGLHRNLWFWVAVSATMVLQVAFNEIAHILVGNIKLNSAQWGICVLIGVLSLLIDLIAKSISTLFKYCLTNSQTGSGMTNSESASNLELPLIN